MAKSSRSKSKKKNLRMRRNDPEFIELLRKRIENRSMKENMPSNISDINEEPSTSVGVSENGNPNSLSETTFVSKNSVRKTLQSKKKRKITKPVKVGKKVRSKSRRYKH